MCHLSTQTMLLLSMLTNWCPYLNTAFLPAAPKWCDTISLVLLKPILVYYSKRPYTNTNTGDEHYMGLYSLFAMTTWYNNTRTLALLMWIHFHNTTTLHVSLVISYLRPHMSWYGKGEKSTPIYMTPWFMWFCHVSIFYTLLYKISNSIIFLMVIYFLSISTLPRISSSRVFHTSL